LKTLTKAATSCVEQIALLRRRWAYHLAHRHGPHAHLDPTLAYHPNYWQRNLDKLTEEVRRSEEIFNRHLLATYSEPLPPVWAVCEVMSIGLLSRWYNSLKPMPTRRAIASVYGVDEKVLQSWLHHLSLIRNPAGMMDFPEDWEQRKPWLEPRQ
jgi:abortive infection bacteriophage resistance protein